MKRFLKNLSLKKSIILYISLFAGIAIGLSIVTAALCSHAGSRVRESYPPIGEKYYLTSESGERLGEGTYISTQTAPMTERDERLLAFLDILPAIATPVYSAMCILTASLLFYRNKLKEPLAQLRIASEKISANDLGFSILYDSTDELGQLCASFECMRATLSENFATMWRQVEERRKLNAAFAHDLRTPLTVLKGYDEMLAASPSESTREVAATIGRHISRMEAYVNSMSRLQRLEDTQPDRKMVFLQPLLSALRESGEIVCGQNGKTLYFQSDAEITRLSIDTAFVSQVFQNLIANAARFAANSVTLSVSVPDDGLQLTVSDDGEGFREESLSRAADPYFTESDDRSAHFGLGLYISKLLCERHGGWLRIENWSGGAKVTAFFRVDKK